jgi:hypothetical protein
MLCMRARVYENNERARNCSFIEHKVVLTYTYTLSRIVCSVCVVGLQQSIPCYVTVMDKLLTGGPAAAAAESFLLHRLALANLRRLIAMHVCADEANGALCPRTYIFIRD